MILNKYNFKTLTIFLFLAVIFVLPSIAMPPGFIPQYAIDQAEQYKARFLQEYSEAASDLTYRFFYNRNGEANLEYTVIPKGRFNWSQTTWIGYTWSNMQGTIGLNEINYTLTKKASDEAEYRMEERRKDPAFSEIERIVLQIANEYDYDFPAIGINARYRSPNTKRAVCEGFSDAITSAFRNHRLVSRVETWSSVIGNHAWNVIVLNDGRKIYCDVTWYDGNHIDEDGFVVNIPDRDPVNLTFDINEFNTLGGAINNATGRVLQVHHAWRDARMQ